MAFLVGLRESERERDRELLTCNWWVARTTPLPLSLIAPSRQPKKSWDPTRESTALSGSSKSITEKGERERKREREWRYEWVKVWVSEWVSEWVHKRERMWKGENNGEENRGCVWERERVREREREREAVIIIGRSDIGQLQRSSEDKFKN